MITKIEALNYRCLRAVSQTLDRFHVVAGPNGSGKSTFFEVPRVLSIFGGKGVKEMLTESGAEQLEELLFLGKGRSFELGVEMVVPESLRKAVGNGKNPQVVRYEVQIGRQEGESTEVIPHILTENLWLMHESAPLARADIVQMELEFPSTSRNDFRVVHDNAPRSNGWKTVVRKTLSGNSYFKSETTAWNLQIRNAPDQSALSALPADDRFPISNWFRQQLLEGQQHLALRSELMKRPSPPLKKGGFLSDGSNLPHVIGELARDKDSFRGWIEHLSTVLPIKNVRVITRDEDKSRYLLVQYDQGQSVPSWHLSDGTLRMLALTLLAYSTESAKTTFVEEPENGIHPQAMETVFQSLSSVYEGQVLVATHSPVLVGLIEPRQLLCFSKTSSGETDIITGDRHPKLRDWKAGLPLARLYAAGILS